MAQSKFNERAGFEKHYSVDLFTSSGCAIILSILLSLDVFKAFQRKALWIPGQALVLTALIIQLLTYVDNYLDLNVNLDDNFLKDDQMYYLVVRPLMFDSRRVMICIFIAYLLPGVVRSGLRTVWGDIGALALPVMWHMGYEVYFFLQEAQEEKSWIPPAPPSPLHPNFTIDAYTRWQLHRSDRAWFRASYITFFTALTLLIVLLTCAVIAGKSIRKIMSQKIPLALSCCCNCPEKHDCNNIQIHVLKCFIVTRASQPDYIIARSVFSAFAGMVNTVCFVFIVIKWIWRLIIIPRHSRKFVYFYIQFVFILIGWTVLLFRWFTAVLYFPKNVSCLFHLEDFWTRSIVDMKNDLDAHLTARLFRKQRILERIPLESIVVNLIMAVRPHSLFFKIGLWLLKLMVLVSKACWCLSDLTFRMIRPFIMSPQQNDLLNGYLSAPEPETDQFYKYEEALEIIRMPGEIAYSLWIANRSAFNKAQNSIDKGFKKSKETGCAELIALMECKTGTVEDETPTSLEVEKHFKDVDVKSWKMRAISSIHFMIYFYDPDDSKVVKDSIEAYSQAWCFMDFVDSLNPEGHLVSLAADKEFETIENIWKKTLQGSNGSNQLLEEKIKGPLKQRMNKLNGELALGTEGQKTQWEDKLHDSQDWMAVAITMAANISLYKTWKAMDLNSNPANAIHDLRCLLANLIAHCIGPELDKAVIENCGRWAKDGKEKEIMNAAFVVGQARAVREQLQI